MLQTAGLPYVQFETKAVPYQDADGHTMYRNQYFVTITSKGSKDSVYKDAESWIDELRTKSQVRAAYDIAAADYDEWYRRFSEAFRRYKEGQEMLFDGTPLKASMAFSPAEVANCENMRLFSLEDLAGCTEEAVQRLGIGGRNLKNKAAKILENNAGGKVAEENAALRLKISDLNDKVDALIKLAKVSGDAPQQSEPAAARDMSIGQHPHYEAEELADSMNDNINDKILGKRGPGRPRREDVAA